MVDGTVVLIFVGFLAVAVAAVFGSLAWASSHFAHRAHDIITPYLEAIEQDICRIVTTIENGRKDDHEAIRKECVMLKNSVTAMTQQILKKRKLRDRKKETPCQA